jgi:bifunctional UDP-N-acetylglucosamine pyrophosphorylase/glucosamine-1-phosphate N-acetyltransferase
MSANVAAVVLAAGKGTRMRSGLAKVLHPLEGRPLLGYVLDAVEAVGASPTIVVVGHQAEAVEAAYSGRQLEFVRQEPPLGTGHALVSARSRFASLQGTLLVVNGDLPLLRAETLRELLAAHRRTGAAATILCVELADPGDYGRIVRDAEGAVLRIVEARDASPAERELREINVGVYALEQLRPQNAQAEYYLTDCVGLLRQAGYRVAAWRAPDPTEALGVNTLGELAEVRRLLRSRRLAALLDAGVTIEDPATTHVGPDVELEPDATLRPFTLLEGRCRVRSGAVVGPFVRLVDVDVGPGAQIIDHCLLRECVVEEGATIGPFAHIRPETIVGRRAKVGNFVELKKTHLAEGSKASHLSYLGDATIGPGVNVGAGTITCNYDGFLKHPTAIGAGAFVGSNTTLVAPVTLGEGSYVAAGSVVTHDVPADALALGRARQLLKDGWARRRREAQKEPRKDKP